MRVHGAFVADDEVHRVVAAMEKPGRACVFRFKLFWNMPVKIVRAVKMVRVPIILKKIRFMIKQWKS